MGSLDRMTCPNTGYSTRLRLTTKVTRLKGSKTTGRTNVSSVLMWLPMKTQGPSTAAGCSRPEMSIVTPAASSARTVSRLLAFHSPSSYRPRLALAPARRTIETMCE